jgi:RNA polymerase sigma-70 factor (ECF subfamily)
LLFKTWNKKIKSTQNPEIWRSFQDIFKSHQEKVLNLCYRFVHNRQDAKDVSQEVFVQVYQSLDRFRGDAQMSTWIYRIAVSKSLDFLRKKKRKKRFAVVKRLFNESNDQQEIDVPDSNTPLSDLEKKDRDNILRWAVDALPENQRIAISLHKYEAFSYQQVADIMNVSLSAVESLIHRAKKNLQKKLYNYYDDLF